MVVSVITSSGTIDNRSGTIAVPLSADDLTLITDLLWKEPLTASQDATFDRLLTAYQELTA